MRTFPTVLNATSINMVLFWRRQLPYHSNAKNATHRAIKIMNIALLLGTY